MTDHGQAIAPSSPTLSDASAMIVASVGNLLKQGQCGQSDARAINTALAALARLYAAMVEKDGAAFPPVDRDALTATETVTLVSGLLRAADLNVFDLAMWFRRAG